MIWKPLQEKTLACMILYCRWVCVVVERQTTGRVPASPSVSQSKSFTSCIAHYNARAVPWCNLNCHGNTETAPTTCECHMQWCIRRCPGVNQSDQDSVYGPSTYLWVWSFLVQLKCSQDVCVWGHACIWVGLLICYCIREHLGTRKGRIQLHYSDLNSFPICSRPHYSDLILPSMSVWTDENETGVINESSVASAAVMMNRYMYL